MARTQAKTKLLTLGAVCVALFLAMLDNTVITVALPAIQRSFGATVSGLQWAFTGYTLFYAALLLTGGTLGDLFGRKRVFLAGLGIFVAGSLVSALAPSLGVLVLGRIVQGSGAAAFLPGSLSLITHAFTGRRERAQAIGLWAGVSGIGIAAGPALGGLLVDSLGWQSIFFINIPIGLVAIGIAAAVVEESKDRQGRTLDLPGQIVAIASLGAVTFALIESASYGWTSVVTIGLLVLAAALLAVFIRVEWRSPSPMLELRFFGNAAFSTGVGVAALSNFAMFGALFFLTLYIQNVQGYSALGMGVRALPLTLAIIVTAPFSGRLAGRIGSRLPMTAGLALSGAGMLLLLRLTPSTSYAQIWWNLALIGAGMGLVSTPMTAAVMAAVPKARSGMASATAGASREVGGLFGVALLGALVSTSFAAGLSDRIRGLSLAPAAKAHVLAIARHAGRADAVALPRGISPAHLQDIVGHAFVAAMLPAIAVAGAILLIGAVIAYRLVPAGVPEEEADRAAREAENCEPARTARAARSCEPPPAYLEQGAEARGR